MRMTRWGNCHLSPKHYFIISKVVAMSNNIRAIKISALIISSMKYPLFKAPFFGRHGDFLVIPQSLFKLYN